MLERDSGIKWVPSSIASLWNGVARSSSFPSIPSKSWARRTSRSKDSTDRSLALSLLSLSFYNHNKLTTPSQAVQEAGEKLNLQGSYIPRSYIELYQEKLGGVRPVSRSKL
jgi:hypothetical protein